MANQEVQNMTEPRQRDKTPIKEESQPIRVDPFSSQLPTEVARIIEASEKSHQNSSENRKESQNLSV